MSISELLPQKNSVHHKIFKHNNARTNFVKGKQPSNAERRYEGMGMYNTICGGDDLYSYNRFSDTSDENLVNLFGSENTPYVAKKVNKVNGIDDLSRDV